MRLEDLMERAAQYDENLARDIKDYVHGRKYGLVYEASKPEFVRMWKKPVVRGDIVNILPPRGVMEDTKNEDDPSEIVYKVKIRQICSEIYEKIPSLDRSTAFAHVISGEGDMYLAPYEVPCVEPQDVQRKSDIRVLFAKEAISTGWDCPRAEVIFSMRPHQDDTYIAQLIGRMVRTPLAESVNIELLNSVSCFLPYFDPATLEKVVKYLTEEGNDDYSGVSRESGREIVTKPVNVEWDHTFGIDDVFTGIASRERAHSTSNYIDGVISYRCLLPTNRKAPYHNDRFFPAVQIPEELLLRSPVPHQGPSKPVR